MALNSDTKLRSRKCSKIEASPAPRAMRLLLLFSIVISKSSNGIRSDEAEKEGRIDLLSTASVSLFRTDRPEIDHASGMITQAVDLPLLPENKKNRRRVIAFNFDPIISPYDIFQGHKLGSKAVGEGQPNDRDQGRIESTEDDSGEFMEQQSDGRGAVRRESGNAAANTEKYHTAKEDEIRRPATVQSFEIESDEEIITQNAKQGSTENARMTATAEISKASGIISEGDGRDESAMNISSEPNSTENAIDTKDKISEPGGDILKSGAEGPKQYDDIAHLEVQEEFQVEQEAEKGESHIDGDNEKNEANSDTIGPLDSVENRRVESTLEMSTLPEDSIETSLGIHGVSASESEVESEIHDETIATSLGVTGDAEDNGERTKLSVDGNVSSSENLDVHEGNVADVETDSDQISHSSMNEEELDSQVSSENVEEAPESGRNSDTSFSDEKAGDDELGHAVPGDEDVSVLPTRENDTGEPKDVGPTAEYSQHGDETISLDSNGKSAGFGEPEGHGGKEAVFSDEKRKLGELDNVDPLELKTLEDMEDQSKVLDLTHQTDSAEYLGRDVGEQAGIEEGNVFEETPLFERGNLASTDETEKVDLQDVEVAMKGRTDAGEEVSAGVDVSLGTNASFEQKDESPVAVDSNMVGGVLDSNEFESLATPGLDHEWEREATAPNSNEDISSSDPSKPLASSALGGTPVPENESHDGDKSPSEPASKDSQKSHSVETSLPGGNKKTSVNDEFVLGLDDLHKFVEEVDPPDELDVGAAGSSMQEVLMGQGVQILKKRVSMGVQHIRKTVTQLRKKPKGRRSDIGLDSEKSEDAVEVVGGPFDFAVVAVKKNKERLARASRAIRKACIRFADQCQSIIKNLFGAGGDDEEDDDVSDIISKLDIMKTRTGQRSQGVLQTEVSGARAMQHGNIDKAKTSEGLGDVGGRLTPEELQKLISRSQEYARGTGFAASGKIDASQ